MLRFFNITKIIAVCACFFSIGLAYSSPIVRIDGSSTVYPIIEAVAEDFQIAKRVQSV